MLNVLEYESGCIMLRHSVNGAALVLPATYLVIGCATRIPDMVHTN